MKTHLVAKVFAGCAGIALGLTLLCVHDSFAAEGAAHGATANASAVYSLETCLQKAVAVSPEIGEARYDVAVYRAKKDQADGAAYPQIEALVIGGPSPEAKRSDISPVVQTDVSGRHINGIFGRGEVTLIQPLYTFGKISGYKAAAASGIKIAEAGTAKKTSDIILRTKELYYSVALAKDMRNLILEIKDDLEKSVRNAQKQIDAESPYADELNLLKLRIFLGEANRNLNETEKGMALAKDALATSMGLPRGSSFDIADTSLSSEARKPSSLSDLITSASLYRPEVAQLKEGLKARRSLVEVQESNQYPHAFIGVKGVLAGASNRDHVKNPYINDYLSSSYGAAFVGLRWAFDFGITQGRIREAEAEYMKLSEKKRFADEAIPLQIRKAYLDYDEATRSIADTEIAVLSAKKWLVTSVANFDLGLSEVRDVGDSAIMYATVKANNLKSKFNQRMSYANILYATGLDQQAK